MPVFITRGMRLGVPAGGLIIPASGIPSLTLHVHFDVCPTWCLLSLQHAAEAQRRASERRLAWAGTDDAAKAASLEREFEASMQAIVAAAVAFDAFYANLKGCLAPPPENTKRPAHWWKAIHYFFRKRRRRRPRHTQVAELIRVAFKLKPKGVGILKNNLRQLFHYRDIAVHPAGQLQAPVVHPELGLEVEWRFAYFRAQNAQTCADVATVGILDLAYNGKAANENIQKYAATLTDRFREIFPDGHPLVPASKPKLV